MNHFKIFIFLLLAVGCNSQEPNDKYQGTSTRIEKNNEGKIKNTNIRYELDTLEWYSQSPKDVVDFMKKTGQRQAIDLEELIAYFTINESPIMSYPSIMILNRQVKGDPPPLDQLERELGAISFSLKDFEPQKKLSEVISDFDFKRPILIKEKRLILMETTAKINDSQTLKVRQSLYFRSRNVIAIQISYIEGEQDRYIKAYDKLVETIEF